MLMQLVKAVQSDNGIVAVNYSIQTNRTRFCHWNAFVLVECVIWPALLAFIAVRHVFLISYNTTVAFFTMVKGLLVLSHVAN